MGGSALGPCHQGEEHCDLATDLFDTGVSIEHTYQSRASVHQCGLAWEEHPNLELTRPPTLQPCWLTTPNLPCHAMAMMFWESDDRMSEMVSLACESGKTKLSSSLIGRGSSNL